MKKINRSVVARGSGRRREERIDGVQGNFRVVNYPVLYYSDGYMSLHYLSEPIECTMPGVNPNVDYILWVMCQYTFNCSKCATLVGDVHSGGGSTYVGSGGIRELSVPSQT